MNGDKNHEQPSRCPGGDPRVQAACQLGGLDVKDRVEEGEQTPWDGSWERRPARGAARAALHVGSPF